MPENERFFGIQAHFFGSGAKRSENLHHVYYDPPFPGTVSEQNSARKQVFRHKTPPDRNTPPRGVCQRDFATQTSQTQNPSLGPHTAFSERRNGFPTLGTSKGGRRIFSVLAYRSNITTIQTHCPYSSTLKAGPLHQHRSLSI